MEPKDALTIARQALVPLQLAGYEYQLGGALALYAHGARSRNVVDSIDLVTEHHYWVSASPRPFVMDVLRLEGYRVELAAQETVRASGVYRDLRVSWPGKPQIALTMQRRPQNIPGTVIEQIPVLDLRECMNHLLHNFYARNEPGDFVDLDAVKAFAGEEQLGRFVLEFLKYRASQIPQDPPAVHHQDFYARLAQVIRHSDADFRKFGHPRPEVLRRSVLELASRVLEATPGGSPLSQDLAQLRAERLALLTAMFDQLQPAQRPNAEQLKTREVRLRILDAAIRARTEAGQRAGQRTGASGPSSSPSSVRQGLVHPSSAEPPRQGPRW
ncbi:hypothetical protein ACH4VR_29160 [Streptomyces sp. NPDC020883]|uniref:hypothetical protein n=1 Tax=Streptomyces sp. NPDC020883 TaxID=3365099 RepID=UPI003798414C